MYKKGLKYFFSNRKALYIILAIVLISISTLTIVYAALSVTLNITGTADISSASWDVHLDNVNVNTQSVSGNAPTISGGTTATFSTKLEVPGDFYEFTIDVVNEGTIDAMIESIVKTPTLTTTQAKYLKYEVEYQNGESINTRQLVKKDDFVRLKVRVEFRNDITPSDLPKTSETLNLSFTVVYVQSDGTGNNVMDGGVTKAKVVNGDYDTIGSEICIQEECFYVISSDETSVTMLAKYNLNVGYIINYLEWKESVPGVGDWQTIVDKNLITASAKQDSSALGMIYDYQTYENIFPWVGTIAFSSDEQKGTKYGDYDGSIVEGYVNEYSTYLLNLGVITDEARLISLDELFELGCTEYAPEKWGGSCENAPDWVTSTSYWTGTADPEDITNGESWYEGDIKEQLMMIWSISNYINSEIVLYPAYCKDDVYYGVRPVITIDKSYF